MSLQEDQTRGAAFFIPNRLDRAIAGQGPWSRVEPGVSDFARYVRREMGLGPYVGFVISNDFIGVKGKENTRIRVW